MGGSHSTVSANAVANVVCNAISNNMSTCGAQAQAKNTPATTNVNQYNYAYGPSSVVSGNTNQLELTYVLHCASNISQSASIQNDISTALQSAMSQEQQQLTGWMDAMSSNTNSNFQSNVATNIKQNIKSQCLTDSLGTVQQTNVAVAGGKVVNNKNSAVANISAKCTMGNAQSVSDITNLTNTANSKSAQKDDSIFQPFVDMFSSLTTSADLMILGFFIFIAVIIIGLGFIIKDII